MTSQPGTPHNAARQVCAALFFTAIIMATFISCYKIALIQQTHTVVHGGVVSGKLVVKATEGSSNGEVKHIYGLFGVRIPVGWEVEGKIIMTQVPKPGTDLGDDDYKGTITRDLVFNQQYTNLLNQDYPREGYTWIGYATATSFKTMFNNADRSKDVDSIYVKFTIATPDDVTGVWYLDYVAGQVGHDHLNDIGTSDRDWNTRVATFYGDNIANTLITDTHVRVVNVDGSYDRNNDEYAQPAEWQLEPMHNSTREGKATAYKDQKYNNLFTRTRGWNGGDGVLTVGLPDGSVLWTFNDSFYGTVNASDRSRGSSSFPRNSIMVQKATNGTLGETAADLVWLADYVNWTDPNADRYFHCRTHLRHPMGNRTDDEIAEGEIDQDYVYWSGDGTIYDGKLQMLWMGTLSTELRTIGTALATYRLDGQMPTGYYLDDIPDYLPQEGDYFYRESVNHELNDNVIPYGSTLWEDEDGHTYLYATNSTDVVMARTETHDLNSHWQYYIRNDSGAWQWQDSYPTTEEMSRSNIMATSDYAVMLPWVFKKGDWYYLTSQAPIFSPYVYIYRAKSPWGPFDERKLLFMLPDHLDKLGSQKYNWLYMVNLHPALSRKGELVFSTNSDSDNFWDNFNAAGSADFYRPFFYRVFDWETVYSNTDTGITMPQTLKRHNDNTYYNLQGMKVNHPTHGIYIVNGRKVVIR